MSIITSLNLHYKNVLLFFYKHYRYTSFEDNPLQAEGRSRATTLYLNDKTLAERCNSNLLNKRVYSQPLIMDMRFDSPRINKVFDAASQIVQCHLINRQQPHPFRLVLANFKADGELGKCLSNSSSGLHRFDETQERTERSYLDLEPVVNPEHLVYLSPDAHTEMESFSMQKVYIIGGLVDKKDTKNISRTIALNERIGSESLPLKRYLKWKGTFGRKEMSLDVIMRILITLRDTGSWINALAHVPKRFHSGLTPEGEHLCGHRTDIIEYFSSGVRRERMFPGGLTSNNSKKAVPYKSAIHYLGR